MKKADYLVLILACVWLACNSSELGEVDVAEQIQRHREKKDRIFKESETSPIPDAHKEDFQGLSYFPIDLKYRFNAPLVTYAKRESFKIVTSSGMERDAQKYGFFEFEIEGRNCFLQVYKLLDIQDQYPNYLFVPFLDATTGRETYPGGRYLDLKENESGIYDLDFNLAYNPSCAYGKAGYNCPIPPQENRLPVALRAGERYKAPELSR